MDKTWDRKKEKLMSTHLFVNVRGMDLGVVYFSVVCARGV